MIELIHLLKDAEENEDVRYGQHQRIAFTLEDLDEKRLEEFLMSLEEFKERIELKKKKKNCLDVLEDIKEMIENQKEGTTEHKEKAKEKKSETQPIPQEGRKLYATKFGEKYHFDKFCKGFNGNANFEWKACATCKSKTEKVLDLSESGSSSSTEARVTDDTLGFEVRGSDYHVEDCTVSRTLAKGSKDKKTMRQLCGKEERLLLWARNRVSTRERKCN